MEMAQTMDAYILYVLDCQSRIRIDACPVVPEVAAGGFDSRCLID